MILVALLTQAPSTPDSFHGYPPWLVVLVGAFVAAILLWIFGKLLKWTIWVLILVVLIGGVIAATRLLLE